MGCREDWLSMVFGFEAVELGWNEFCKLAEVPDVSAVLKSEAILLMWLTFPRCGR